MIICYGSLLRLLLTITCLEYFQLAAAFSMHSSNSSRIKRATCSSFEFTCANKQCVSKFAKCDGHADCSDKSDETSALCWNSGTLCEPYSFQCAYGACVDGQFRCNGAPDCVDGSDERNCPQTTNTSTSNTGLSPEIGCSVPQIPGARLIYRSCPASDTSSKCTAQPGTKVTVGSELRVQCEDDHLLWDRFSIISCGASLSWTQLPTCKRTCEPVVNPNLNLKCLLVEFPHGQGTVERDVNCSKPQFEGTRVIATCPSFFKQRNRQIAFCSNGKWDKELVDCEPVCGFSDKSINETIWYGETANHRDFPWHVGIYWVQPNQDTGLQTFKYVCGGSLITQNKVLTAAHCGWDKDNEKWTLAQDIYVALGKQKSIWETQAGNYTQWYGTAEFRRPPEYSGRRSLFIFDIAMIVIETQVTLSEFVYPVCLNFDPDLFGPNAVGIVPGWGRTEASKQSEELRKATVPFVPPSSCNALLTNDEVQFYTFDKFCGGYSVKGPRVSQGDSGGGLIYKSGKVSYLVGIVSTTLARDDFWVSFYTNVSYHFHTFWIRDNLKRN